MKRNKKSRALFGADLFVHKRTIVNLYFFPASAEIISERQITERSDSMENLSFKD